MVRAGLGFVAAGLGFLGETTTVNNVAPPDHTVLVAIIGLLTAVSVATIAAIAPIMMDRYRTRKLTSKGDLVLTPLERRALELLLEQHDEAHHDEDEDKS